ncbi:MAG TPA: hypothetical protein VGH28_19585 [Polyangiaceae bacterium]
MNAHALERDHHIETSPVERFGAGNPGDFHAGRRWKVARPVPRELARCALVVVGLVAIDAGVHGVCERSNGGDEEHERSRSPTLQTSPANMPNS